MNEGSEVDHLLLTRAWMYEMMEVLSVMEVETFHGMYYSKAVVLELLASPTHTQSFCCIYFLLETEHGVSVGHSHVELLINLKCPIYISHLLCLFCYKYLLLEFYHGISIELLMSVE